MTTTVSDPLVQPAVPEQTHDRLHFERLLFEQDRSQEMPGDIRVELVCWRYCLNPEGGKVYHPTPIRGGTRDFLNLALTEAVEGGATTEEALLAYSNAKKEVSDAHILSPYTTFELMAYFELTLGMLAEKLNISTLEKIE